jgi:hypothetical protein
LFQQEEWMSFRFSMRCLALFGAFVCGALALQVQTASAACTTLNGTIKNGAAFHGASCNTSGTWCSCSVEQCIFGIPGHVTSSSFGANCQPMSEQLTANPASNQTGYDFYYSGTYFPPGKQIHAFLSGGYLQGSTDLGPVTTKKNGSFTGYRSLTCPVGTPAPQNMTLTVDTATTSVFFSCAVRL